MKRFTLAALAALVLAVTFAPSAQAATEGGTVEFDGVILYSRSGSTSSLGFAVSTCLHTWTPATPDLDAVGWHCRNFALGDSTATGTTFALTGRWTSKGRTYYMNLALNDALFTPLVPQTATGTVSSGGRTGPAVLSFVALPHADANRYGVAATLQYTLG